jgi:hypothetical protein
LDATPQYLVSLNKHKSMAKAFPDARIVISLRNPVDRAYSQYNHYMQMLPKTEDWDWQAPGGSFADNVYPELDAHDATTPPKSGEWSTVGTMRFSYAAS